MTKITYYDFPINKSNLVDYVKSIKSDRKHHLDPQNQPYHINGVVGCIVAAMGENKFNFDPADPEVCILLEQLVREYGYDMSGHYSDTAKNALKNLYLRRGLNPDFAELKDVQVNSSFKQHFLNIKSSAKEKMSSFFQPIKKFYQKHKKVLFGVILLGAGLVALKSTVSNLFKSTKDPVKKEIKASQVKQSVSPDTFVWQPQAFSKQQTILPDSLLNLRLDTIRRIESNKQAYQESKISQNAQQIETYQTPSAHHLSHNDSIENKPYISSLKLHHSEHLITTVENQIAKGIFKAEKGLTKERIAHAYLMCQIYANYDRAGTKIVLDAVNSQNKLTPAQQKAFTNYIINGVGERGIKLQSLSIQKGNKNHHSAFSRASKKQQQNHIRTLQDVRRLHGR